MFNSKLHIRPIKTRGHSFRCLCQNVSKNATRKRQIRIKGATCAFAAFVASGVVLYKESSQLHRQLQLTTNVFDMEKQTSYIYLLESDYDEGDGRHKNKDKTIWFPWLQSRILSYDPWSLLRLARVQDHGVRLLGVQALADQHHWTDAQYRMIAQALDPMTLVGLARSLGVDLKFFLPMPKLKPPQRELHYELQLLLSALSTDDLDKCTEFLSARALRTHESPEDQESYLSFDSSGQATERRMKSVPSPGRIEIYSMQALLGHSKLANHCRELVHAGGLAVLQRLYEVRGDQQPVVHTLARILANLTLCEDLHEDIIHAGWVSVFAAWMKSTDLALVLLATKALAHLDQDFSDKKYVDGVYLYHPQHRNCEPLKADIVFVHGLLGGPFKTWRQINRKNTKPDSSRSSDGETEGRRDNSHVDLDTTHNRHVRVNKRNVIRETTDTPSEATYTQCWPRDWLADDVPGTRIVSVEYETQISGWAVTCPVGKEQRTLITRSRELLQKLRQAGVGDRPVVWVGHSMGGLLIKQMLLFAREDPDNESLVNNTRGIVFYSVPNKGTPLANTKRAFRYIISPTVEVEELKQGAKPLLALHSQFIELVHEMTLSVLSFGEGSQVKLPLHYSTIMVPRDSSDPGVGHFFLMENLDHLDICKPRCRDSVLYHMTKEFIRSCVEQPGTTKERGRHRTPQKKRVTTVSNSNSPPLK